MGNIILCHSVKAKNPYEITRIHRKIYTIEELCYYLSQNIYLVDNTIMNESFCNWLAEELLLTDLSYELKTGLLERKGTIEFVLSILQSTDIYTKSDLLRIQNKLATINDLRDVERRKYKADNLLRNNEVEEAILVYQAILRGDRDDTLPETFYGKVYASLGAAYGRAFLYQDAMKMYDKAFQICNDPMLVKCVLYAASKTMKEKEYKLFVSQSEVFEEIQDMLECEIENMREKVDVETSDELLEQWKQEYRTENM